ncbi:MAG: DNA repair protein RecO [Lentisphaerae bacterium]|nr:DNA repair protein RecO [Lentisphaerota bacterium]
MMMVKTEAITLRVTPYSNTSQIVTWIAASGEVLTTMIKGACRPKSAFLGQYDLFGTSELLFYRSHGDGMHVARECAMLEPRLKLRQDWKAFACASYVCHFILTTSMAGESYPHAYRLASTVLDALSLKRARLEATFWFELQWLGHLGFAPQLFACTRCRRPLAQTEAAPRWGVEGVICQACSQAHPGAQSATTGTLPLRPDLLAILRRWQSQPQPRILATTQCSPRQLLEFNRLLGIVISYHMDNPPESRKIALDLMHAGAGMTGRPS